MRDKELKIYCWGDLVGTLSWSQEKGTSIFSFDRGFREKGIDLFPIVYPVRGAQSDFSYVSRRIMGQYESKDDGMPPFISDSLPDDWGSLLFEDWAKGKNLNMKKFSRLEKLSYIGSRGAGALEFEPAIRFPKDRDALRLFEIVSLARKISNNRERLAILPDESKTLQRLFELGSSAGGRRPKAFIAIDRETGEIRSGQVRQKDSFDYFILKVDDDKKIPLNRIEMTYYQMATAAGLPMSPSRLMDMEGSKCFLTRRYDRADGEKLHTQSLAAMRPGAKSYEELLTTCRMLNLPSQDIETVFRQAVFNVFSGNTDDHPRNFEFILPKNGKWRLSPPFDINYIVHDYNEDIHGYHCLSLSGKLHDITEDDLLSFAADNSITNARHIINSVCNAITSFREHAAENGMSPYWTARIEKDIQKLLPERFKEKMDKWTVMDTVDSYDGVPVRELNFELSSGGNMKVSAVIDGIPVKKIFDEKKPETDDILKKGGNNMPLRDKIEYIKRYLFPVAIKTAGGLDSALCRQFDDLETYGLPPSALLELAKNGRIWFRGEIFHTPVFVFGTAGSECGVKPKREVDIMLSVADGNVRIGDPYSGADVGEAVSTLKGSRNLLFKETANEAGFALSQSVKHAHNPNR